MSQPTLDVAVIGAGLTGLTCAQQLQQQGLTVGVFDKSRGLGGRLATRRIQSHWIDHGVRYWQAQGDRTQHLLDTLLQHNILQPWAASIGELNQAGQVTPLHQAADPARPYVSPIGITAIAKFMAQDLTVHRSQRAIALMPTPAGTWRIQFDHETEASEASARAVVLAIPAPQALPLLTPLVQDGLPSDVPQQLQRIEFDPCISVMAGYDSSQLPQDTLLLGQWQALKPSVHPLLSWVSLEQSKAKSANQPLLLIQSTATFAEPHLDADDLKPAGDQLLAALAERDRPEWTDPAWMQVHRWRYAFAHRPLGQPCLATNMPLPLICCGDWCLGSSIENALQSGAAAAAQLAETFTTTL